MPIALTEQITRPSIVKMEIFGFSVDLRGGRIELQFAHLTADNDIAGVSSGSASLYVNDVPQFTAAEYASIKGALYRIAVEQGLVAGVVE